MISATTVFGANPQSGYLDPSDDSVAKPQSGYLDPSDNIYKDYKYNFIIKIPKEYRSTDLGNKLMPFKKLNKKMNDDYFTAFLHNNSSKIAQLKRISKLEAFRIIFMHDVLIKTSNTNKLGPLLRELILRKGNDVNISKVNYNRRLSYPIVEIYIDEPDYDALCLISWRVNSKMPHAANPDDFGGVFIIVVSVDDSSKHAINDLIMFLDGIDFNHFKE